MICFKIGLYYTLVVAHITNNQKMALRSGLLFHIQAQKDNLGTKHATCNNVQNFSKMMKTVCDYVCTDY